MNEVALEQELAAVIWVAWHSMPAKPGFLESVEWADGVISTGPLSQDQLAFEIEHTEFFGGRFPNLDASLEYAE